jgi:surfeit locus 1 family protein
VILTKLVSRRWWWMTLLVIAGVVGLVRLGIWQLDRLEQRRAFNTTVASRWQQDPIDLVAEGLPDDLAELEFRRVEVNGVFDYDNQIVLKERPRDGVPGVILVTPLVLDDGRAILVARGWVPYNLSAPQHWTEFEEEPDQPVIGLIQESQRLPSGLAPTAPDEAQTEWFLLNMDAVQPQMPYELLPVFILQLPEPDRSRTQYPIRDEPMRLDEGNHFSYAIQWFMFAAVLGVGYLFLIQYHEARSRRLAEQTENVQYSDSFDADLHDSDTPNRQSGDSSRRIPEMPPQGGPAQDHEQSMIHTPTHT